MVHDFLSLVVAPVIAGIVIALFEKWLNNQDDN